MPRTFARLLWLDMRLHAKSFLIYVVSLLAIETVVSNPQSVATSAAFVAVVVAIFGVSAVPTIIIARDRSKRMVRLLLSLCVTRLELAIIKLLESFILGLGSLFVPLLMLWWLAIVPPNGALTWLVLVLVAVPPLTIIASGLSLLLDASFASYAMLGISFAYVGLIDRANGGFTPWSRPLYESLIFIVASALAIGMFSVCIRLWTLRSISE